MTISKSSKNSSPEGVRNLDGHTFRSVRDSLDLIVRSDHSLLRNDRYGQGGFVAEFEAEIAEIMGKEMAVFMPSGTMAQQIALRIWSDRSGCKNVAFHPTCHLEIYEHSAYRVLHGLNGILLGEKESLFTLRDLQDLEDPISTLLIELPQREIGGQLPTWEELTEICDFARSGGVRLHLDGARLWECQPYYQKSYSEIVAPFDSLYVSFYKILGGLPGAVLAGSESFIAEAKIWQRRHGGNLQQQAASAISAKIGLDHHLPRITEYVSKAKGIAKVLEGFPEIRVVPSEPQTNMMHVYFQGERQRLLDASQRIVEEDGVRLLPWLNEQGKTEISVCTGALEINDQELEDLLHKLLSLSKLA